MTSENLAKIKYFRSVYLVQVSIGIVSKEVRTIDSYFTVF